MSFPKLSHLIPRRSNDLSIKTPSRVTSLPDCKHSGRCSLLCSRLHARTPRNAAVRCIISSPQFFAPAVRIWKVAPGNAALSAVTVACMPKLARHPLIRPAGKYRNGCTLAWLFASRPRATSPVCATKAACIAASYFFVSKDMRPRGLNVLSVRTYMPRWLVLRLSICFRNRSIQRSLQRNFMQSRGVVGRGASRENLDGVSDDVLNAHDPLT